MEGWVKWLGEFVWRLTRWPEGVKGNEREENFWYRTYGVGSLILALAFGLWLVAKIPEPISKLVTMAATYTGADKALAQSYIGGLLALMIGVPIVVCGVFLLATGIVFVWLVAVGLTKGLWMAIGWAAAKYLARQSKEIQAAAAGAVLGWLAGRYLARSSGTKEVAAAAAQALAPASPEGPPQVAPVPPELQNGGAGRERQLG